MTTSSALCLDRIRGWPKLHLIICRQCAGDLVLFSWWGHLLASREPHEVLSFCFNHALSLTSFVVSHMSDWRRGGHHSSFIIPILSALFLLFNPIVVPASFHAWEVTWGSTGGHGKKCSYRGHGERVTTFVRLRSGSWWGPDRLHC